MMPGTESRNSLPSLDPRLRHLVRISGAIAGSPEGQMRSALAEAIDDRTLGRGSVAGDEYLRNMYRHAGNLLNGRPRDLSAPRPERREMTGHWFESVDETLGFLTEAGFAPVDVFWKQLSNALIGGYKPA